MARHLGGSPQCQEPIPGVSIIDRLRCCSRRGVAYSRADRFAGGPDAVLLLLLLMCPLSASAEYLER